VFSRLTIAGHSRETWRMFGRHLSFDGARSSWLVSRNAMCRRIWFCRSVIKKGEVQTVHTKLTPLITI